MDKRGLTFNFAWIFAILVGAVIIFLSIYGITKLIGTERQISDTEAGKQIGILLNPIETSIGSAKVSKILMPIETRLYNDCELDGNFGSQGISVATKSGFLKKWDEPGVISKFKNKYVFSEKVLQGDEFIAFSKPFEMPYKVADIIYLWDDNQKYCFVKPPISIKEEINSLKPSGINISEDIRFCPKESKKVCFENSGCDIDVSMNSGNVVKNWTTIHYEGEALLYAAIFSSSEIYECQVKRLMKRTSELALLYSLKAQYLNSKGCSTNLETDMLLFSNNTEIQSSSELRDINILAETIKEKNSLLKCRLF